MSFQLSKIGLKRLDTCHILLQQLVFEVLKSNDVTVLCGHRTEEEQNACFRRGASKVKWPHSKHNTTPSMAVDMVPYPIDWKDIKRFKELKDIVKEAWSRIEHDGYELSCGGDWKWKDYPHYEIRRSST